MTEKRRQDSEVIETDMLIEHRPDGLLGVLGRAEVRLRVLVGRAAVIEQERVRLVDWNTQLAGLREQRELSALRPVRADSRVGAERHAEPDARDVSENEETDERADVRPLHDGQAKGEGGAQAAVGHGDVP